MIAHHRRLFFLIALALMFLSFFFPYSAAAAQNGDEWIVFDFYTENSCVEPHELVYVVMRHHSFYTENVNGRTSHFTAHFNAHGRGVGESTGTEYLFNYHRQESFQGHLDSGHWVETIVDSVNLISQGNTPNFRIRMEIHLAINQQGITSSINRVETECQGR